MIRVFNFLSIVFVIAGGWLLMISGIILDLEYACGIHNMSKETGLRLMFIFLLAIVFTVSSVLLKRYVDNHKC